MITVIQAIWVISIYILIRLALRRVEPSLSLDDWKYQTQLSRIKPRGNVITLLKIYSKVSRSTPRELAVNIRDEMSGNASRFYEKPHAFFVKYRTDDKMMEKYFEDEEVRLFFKDPKLWAALNGAVKVRFWGLFQDETTPSTEYYENISRVLKKFENSLVKGKGVTTPKITNR